MIGATMAPTIGMAAVAALEAMIPLLTKAPVTPTALPAAIEPVCTTFAAVELAGALVHLAVAHCAVTSGSARAWIAAWMVDCTVVPDGMLIDCEHLLPQ